MDSIDIELRSRHELDAAYLRPDPTSIIRVNPAVKARWILWSHGAAGLLARDKERAGVWLQACYELLEKEEHRVDLLWTAEVFTALSELSLLDGEYFDALRRSQNGCVYWRSIETSLSARVSKDCKSASAEFSFGPKEYVDGVVSDAIQRNPDEKLRGGGATEEMVRERAIGKFLSCIQVALNANEYVGRYDPDLVHVTGEFLAEHAEIISHKARYKIFIAFGNQASSAGQAQVSLDWFERAVDVYYQHCEDENDLYRLVSAMFNKANSLAQLERYDEALQIYRMIAGDFEKFGDYEAELRIDYAILHTRYKKGELQGIEVELRALVAAYRSLIDEAASERRRIDARNLDVVKSLLLTVILSKPSSIETFLEGIALAERGKADPGDVVKHYFERQNGTFTDWRGLQPIDLLDAYLTPHADTVVLMFESGVDKLLAFALQGGAGLLSDRCHCAALSVEFYNAFVQLFEATREENDRIIERRKTTHDPSTDHLRRLGEAIWTCLPHEIRKMIESSNRLFIVLSPFGNISEFPVELIMTGRGWVGLTHAVCHTNSIATVVASLSDNGTPRQVNNTALVLRAGDPDGMAPLQHTQQEADDVVRYAKILGLCAKGPVTLDPDQLIEELTAQHHLFHYVGHGSATVLGEKLLLSADRWLPSPWLRRIVAHRAPIAFLSACEMGRARLAGGSEKGFVLELLKSGSPGVIAATRPVSDRVSGDIVREIYAASMQNASLPEAIRSARRNLDAEKLNPVCWSAYVFYGRPDAALKPNGQAPGEYRWHQLLMRYLASGAQDHRSRMLEALRKTVGEDQTLNAVEKLLHKAKDGDRKGELVSDLAAHDLIGALRLRAYLGVLRVERAIEEKKFDNDYLLKEIGTSMNIALRIHDSFAFVGAARRHCQLLGTVTLDEITTVLGHAVRLSEAMAAHDALFQPAFEELTRENNLYQGKVLMNITKVVPQSMLDR